jgi:hypothetical protein
VVGDREDGQTVSRVSMVADATVATLKRKETLDRTIAGTVFSMAPRGAVASLIELGALKIAVSREASAIKNLLGEADNSKAFARRARRESSVAAAELIEDRAHELEAAVASRQARLRSMLGKVGIRSTLELAAFRPPCACCGHRDLVEAYKGGNEWVGRECYHHYPLQRCHSLNVGEQDKQRKSSFLGIDRSHAGPVEIELQEGEP